MTRSTTETRVRVTHILSVEAVRAIGSPDTFSSSSPVMVTRGAPRPGARSGGRVEQRRCRPATGPKQT